MAVTPFTNQCIQFGTLALDISSGTATLAPMTGSPGQCWSLTVLADGVTCFLVQASNPDMALDPTIMQVAAGWFDASSNQALSVIPATWGEQMQFVCNCKGQALTASGSSVVLAAVPGATLTTPPAYAPPPPPTGSYAPSDYVKVWEDTFTGTALDTSKWWTRYPAPNDQYLPSNNEQQVYEEGQDGEPNHVMTGSSVKLTAYPPRASDGRYPSGMIRSKQALNTSSQTTAFYIEVVAKIPSAAGAWPAFWSGAAWKAAGTPPPWPPEIDFAEFMIQGSNPTSIIHQSIKFNGATPGPWNGSDSLPNTPVGWTWASPYGDTQWDTNVDFSAGFHTFGFLYRPGTTADTTFPNYWVTPNVPLPLVNPATGQNTHFWTLSVDGVSEFAGQYDANVGADGSLGWNMSIILNLAVGGVGGGTPNNAEFPCAFEIQRVSVFLSQEDSTMLVPDTIGVDYLPASGG